MSLAPAWHDEAACAGQPAEWWFPDVDRFARRAEREAALEAAVLAKRVCGTCPVRVACRADAVRRRERFGIWGGIDMRKPHRRARDPEPALVDA